MKENFTVRKFETESYLQRNNSLQIELVRRMGYELNDTSIMAWIHKHAQDLRTYIDSHEMINEKIRHGTLSEEDYAELMHALQAKSEASKQ